MTVEEIKRVIKDSKKSNLTDSEKESAIYWLDHYPLDDEELENADPKIFGSRVALFRTILGKTQVDLAGKLDITGAALAQIETGKRNSIDPEKLYEITGILGCSPHNLIGKAIKFGNIYDVESGKEFSVPIRPLPNSERINDLHNALLQLPSNNPGLCSSLIALLDTNNQIIYDRLYDLLWAVFYDELIQLGVSKK